jgi:hypothetical protein
MNIVKETSLLTVVKVEGGAGLVLGPVRLYVSYLL